jgi:hypothetical protein
VAKHRGDHNRLGVAVQLGSLRFLGTLLEEPARAPASAVRFAADQLAITGSAELMTVYANSAGRWRHGSRIRERYGYRAFADFGIAFRLNRFLYALCWTGADRPSALFDRAAAWLLEAKVLLPGLSVLAFSIVTVAAPGNARWTSLAHSFRGHSSVWELEYVAFRDHPRRQPWKSVSAAGPGERTTRKPHPRRHLSRSSFETHGGMSRQARPAPKPARSRRVLLFCSNGRR